MEPESSLGLPSPLESVQYQFDKWRETRKSPREPIPQNLWKAAVELRAEYSIGRISKALRLNHTDLKNRIFGQKSDPQTKKQSPPLFVELDCCQSFPTSESIIEMEDSSGSKMRMRLRGKADLDLLELAKAFWRKGK